MLCTCQLWASTFPSFRQVSIFKRYEICHHICSDRNKALTQPLESNSWHFPLHPKVTDAPLDLEPVSQTRERQAPNRRQAPVNATPFLLPNLSDGATLLPPQQSAVGISGLRQAKDKRG